MGQPDQFAKRTFAEETEQLTHGAVTWQDPPEVSLTKVQGDGMLLVRDPSGLAGLDPPWTAARDHDEVLLEIKMAGDHTDVVTVQRALLRRQARQVERVEADRPAWLGEEPLWIVAPHVPAVLREIREVTRVAAGCYRIGPSAFAFLWIAANELPLRDDLVPFLVARSGRALDEFGCWVANRRPVAWVLDLIEYTTMSLNTREEVFERIKTDDPELEERRRHIGQMFLRDFPELANERVEETRRRDLRVVLREVLAGRGLVVGADESARIDACSDPDTLHRWVRQAVVAASTEEALRSPPG